MTHLMGPALRDQIASALRSAGIDGGVKYVYVDPGFQRAPVWEQLKTSPEYEAEYIRISAFPMNMGGALEPIEEVLRAAAGCIEVRKITTHKSLRPQVQAVFRRKVDAVAPA